MGLFRRKPSVDPAQLAAVAADVAALRAAVTEFAHRLDASTGEQLDLRIALTDLEHRVSAVGTELTNQLTELSGDIDGLTSRPDPTPAIAALERVQTGQERLANEQARYQIAFREDLAALADEVARKRQ